MLFYKVLFIHRYSGNMPLNTALAISSSYLLSAITMIYAQHLAVGLPDPTTDLLSQLRKGGDDDTGYKIPKDGLFEFVTCPHYLFEITGFFGFAMISQTVYALAMAFGTAAYLVSRSFATRRWYESKFEEFPASIKALVPYIL